MKCVHSIKVNVFCKENDNHDIIQKKLISLFPFNLEKEKIKLERNKASGFDDNKITILGMTLTKERHTNEFLKNLISHLTDNQKETILNQIETRLDPNLDFFLRFDKPDFLKNNELNLTDSGNCFHVKISIAAFPKKREIAIEIIKKILQD